MNRLIFLLAMAALTLISPRLLYAGPGETKTSVDRFLEHYGARSQDFEASERALGNPRRFAAESAAWRQDVLDEALELSQVYGAEFVRTKDPAVVEAALTRLQSIQDAIAHAKKRFGANIDIPGNAEFSKTSDLIEDHMAIFRSAKMMARAKDLTSALQLMRGFSQPGAWEGVTDGTFDALAAVDASFVETTQSGNARNANPLARLHAASEPTNASRIERTSLGVVSGASLRPQPHVSFGEAVMQPGSGFSFDWFLNWNSAPRRWLRYGATAAISVFTFHAARVAAVFVGVHLLGWAPSWLQNVLAGAVVLASGYFAGLCGVFSAAIFAAAKRELAPRNVVAAAATLAVLSAAALGVTFAIIHAFPWTPLLLAAAALRLLVVYRRKIGSRLLAAFRSTDWYKSSMIYAAAVFAAVMTKLFMGPATNADILLFGSAAVVGVLSLGMRCGPLSGSEDYARQLRVRMIAAAAIAASLAFAYSHGWLSFITMAHARSVGPTLGMNHNVYAALFSIALGSTVISWLASSKGFRRAWERTIMPSAIVGAVAVISFLGAKEFLGPVLFGAVSASIQPYLAAFGFAGIGILGIYFIRLSIPSWKGYRETSLPQLDRANAYWSAIMGFGIATAAFSMMAAIAASQGWLPSLISTAHAIPRL